MLNAFVVRVGGGGGAEGGKRKLAVFCTLNWFDLKEIFTHERM